MRGGEDTLKQAATVFRVNDVGSMNHYYAQDYSVHPSKSKVQEFKLVQVLRLLQAPAVQM
jgi:hypothetical protein